MKSFNFNESCKTYKEFLEKVSEEQNIKNTSEYFFYSEIDDKKYGIFNESTFKIFKDAIKDKNEDIKIIYRTKKEMIKEHKNSEKKDNENSFDISNLKKDDITDEIDEIINEYIDKYKECLEEIKKRKVDLTNSRIDELKRVSYNPEVNELFIDQITYENVIKNCGPLPIPEDNVSKYFKPQKEETCEYCGTNNINQLYGCEECQIKICEYCFQGLKTYQHYHKLCLYKTN